MRVTHKLVKAMNPCSDGWKWFIRNFSALGGSHKTVLNKLAKTDHWDWFNWLATRLMSHPQRIEWAIFCAEQVIGIYEAKYPKDGRPRKAIAAAKVVLANDTAKNRATAYAAAAANVAAANAADDADAANAADAAANAAANAAYAAAYAADAAASADQILAAFAEGVVQILIEMKAPGCKWLEAA